MVRLRAHVLEPAGPELRGLDRRQPHPPRRQPPRLVSPHLPRLPARPPRRDPGAAVSTSDASV